MQPSELSKVTSRNNPVALFRLQVLLQTFLKTPRLLDIVQDSQLLGFKFPVAFEVN